MGSVRKVDGGKSKPTRISGRSLAEIGRDVRSERAGPGVWGEPGPARKGVACVSLLYSLLGFFQGPHEPQDFVRVILR